MPRSTRYAQTYDSTGALAPIMFVLHSLGAAVTLCIITMLGWGSWANTQKLAGKDRWAFPLYY